MRSAASLGVELIDLLLNPDHIVRTVDEVTLRSTLILARRVQLDLSFDRLSRHREEAATQLSALAGGRVDAEPVLAERPAWIPLDTVPRPVSGPVSVVGSDGRVLPRPRQSEVRAVLGAGIYQVLGETLRAHPDFDRDGSSVSRLMKADDPARWLLQGAVLSLCDRGPSTPRSEARAATFARRMREIGEPDAHGDPLVALDKLARSETNPHRHTALEVLRHVLVNDEPFVSLVDLVHRNYFVIAGLDRHRREQSVQFDLPDCEALRHSVIRNSVGRNLRMLDPRQHNYTVHIRVPLPENVREYNVHVRALAGSEASGPRPGSEVSLIARVRYDDHPGRTAIDAINTCADVLTACLAGDGSPPSPEGTAAPQDALPRSHNIRFVARQALGELDRLESIVDLQAGAADYLAVRWHGASAGTVSQSVSRIDAVTQRAKDRLRVAHDRLVDTASCESAESLPDKAALACQALDAARESVEDPALGFQLVSGDVPGQETARIAINRSDLASRAVPRPRFLDVWATVTDEALPYPYAALAPPLGLAILIYMVGALLFDLPAWPVDARGPLDTSRLSSAPDALVAVLLLIPAFALTQVKPPGRASVPGLLRRPAFLVVLGAVMALSVTAIMVATQVGSSDPESTHPHLLLWTFRVALAVFAVWSGWAAVAWALRRRYVWCPKGLQTLVDDIDTTKPAAAGRLDRLRRSTRYGTKAPDADFDLSLPARSFPSRPARRSRSS